MDGTRDKRAIEPSRGALLARRSKTEPAVATDVDMGVGMAGVVMIDGDPVESLVEVLLHLPHGVVGAAAQVASKRRNARSSV